MARCCTPKPPPSRIAGLCPSTSALLLYQGRAPLLVLSIPDQASQSGTRLPRFPCLHSRTLACDGHVTDLHFTVSHRQLKRIAIDQQSNDHIMHLGRAGKADRLTHEAFDPGVQRQVLALYFLCVALARLVLLRIEMTRVRTPIVWIIPRDAKRCSQRLELEKDLIGSVSKVEMD